MTPDPVLRSRVRMLVPACSPSDSMPYPDPVICTTEEETRLVSSCSELLKSPNESPPGFLVCALIGDRAQSAKKIVKTIIFMFITVHLKIGGLTEHEV